MLVRFSQNADENIDLVAVLSNVVTVKAHDRNMLHVASHDRGSVAR